MKFKPREKEQVRSLLEKLSVVNLIYVIYESPLLNKSTDVQEASVRNSRIQPVQNKRQRYRGPTVVRCAKFVVQCII